MIKGFQLSNLLMRQFNDLYILTSPKVHKNYPAHDKINGISLFVHDLWELKSNIFQEQFCFPPWKLFMGTNLISILLFKLMALY